MEQTRMFTTNISSGMEEIRPFVERPIVPYSTLLNVQGVESPATESTSSSADNFVINIEEQPVTNSNDGSAHDTGRHHRHETSTMYSFLNDIHEAMGNNQSNDNNSNAVSHNNNNDVDETSTEAMRFSHRLRKGYKRYIPLVVILILKGLYDHSTNILNFIVLLVTFNHTNYVVKREIAKQNNKSWMALLIVTCCVVGCIVFIHFEYDTHIFSPYTQQPLTIWELLWSVLITDFVLKLITIIFKVLLTCLPSKILALRKRGKYFLMVEATSQLYRCIAPVQSWLYYLFDSYQGSEKIVGVLLSLLYTVSKGHDLLFRIKLFQTAIWKLLQNVNLGASPSKEQVIASGGICAICHEQYSTPVRLHCKHIFCETCVVTWLNRECSCPLCRATITDDPVYWDGHTTHFVHLY